MTVQGRAERLQGHFWQMESKRKNMGLEERQVFEENSVSNPVVAVAVLAGTGGRLGIELREREKPSGDAPGEVPLPLEKTASALSELGMSSPRHAGLSGPESVLLRGPGDGAQLSVLSAESLPDHFCSVSGYFLLSS